MFENTNIPEVESKESRMLNDVSEGTLIHTYLIQPPELDRYGRCADCGLSSEFMFAPAAHYSSCNWAETNAPLLEK